MIIYTVNVTLTEEEMIELLDALKTAKFTITAKIADGTRGTHWSK